MTRKDYKRLAEELKIELNHLDSTLATNDAESIQRGAFEIAVRCMCDAMKRENPRFDRDKFLLAVGL